MISITEQLYHLFVPITIDSIILMSNDIPEGDRPVIPSDLFLLSGLISMIIYLVSSPHKALPR